ncbi:cyclin N-terminal domain-containing protein 1 isoform X2 [Pundamilia nyererei]|uniref:Cyclin N-terminal domain-containing protein 1 isoform X2 n=1 Tax=Pundamilia nyererei TaxID=303518 RepID=A0A9Y3R269_9CICH|nr:PREDICTED: cyclin N-terminal domain-containing protein 1 isoform X2 [Pundamilia nyererei]
MAKRLFFSPSKSNAAGVKFGEASFDLLTDFLVNLDKRNKDNLLSSTKYCGNLKNKRVIEYILLITNKLRLDPLVGYHAVELLQRFMVKYIEDFITAPTPKGATSNHPRSYEDAVHNKLKDKFPLIIFSCVQLASKLSLHSHASSALPMITYTLLESELMVLKGLKFRLNVLNPLTYVEILLEVLGHNEPSVPMKPLYHHCHHVLQFISLERTAIYETLLMTTTERVSPSREQREQFVPVTEDCMLLGVGVIAVAAFILRKWEQVVGELSHITRISKKSITDFAHATLVHIVGISSSVTPLS